jgi:hypothetical protein
MSACLWITPPVLTFECVNQSLWNLVCISWHLSPSRRRTSQIPPNSLCVCTCMCNPPITVWQKLGNDVPVATKNTWKCRFLWVTGDGKQSSASHLLLLLLWCLAWLILRSWRWRQYVAPKRPLLFNGQYGFISQKYQYENLRLYAFKIHHCVVFDCSALSIFSFSDVKHSISYYF